MKTNKMMRIASVLLVAVLLSTCAISGTFAKYVTTASGNDSARVAKWGFGTASIDFENLFASSYTNVAAGSDEMAIIAPGTEGEVSFQFISTGNPEVDYTFEVDAKTNSSCDDSIELNTNIQWALATSETKDNAAWGTFEALLESIEALSGDASGSKIYTAGSQLPAIVNEEYIIMWKWPYGDGTTDTPDNTLGDAAATSNTDLIVKLAVSISATQVGD